MAEAQGKLGKHPRAKKKGKAYYTGRKKVKQDDDKGRGRGPVDLRCGMQGVLITTGDQEKLCVPEAYNLLNKCADQLYGPEFSVSSSQGSEGSSDDDISAAIAKEVRDLKGSEKRERRFKSVNSGARHMVFIECAPPVEPCQLVHTLLSDVAKSRERVSRYCQRMLPVVRVCHANMAEISKHSAEVLEPHFHSDHTSIVRYAVSYKARNNSVMKRDDVIKLIAGVVTKEGDYDHVVDLNNPELTVVVEIIKNLCCLSVVKDYHKLSKYNIHTLTEPSKDPGIESGGERLASKDTGSKDGGEKLASKDTGSEDGRQKLASELEDPSMEDGGEKQASKDTGSEDGGEKLASRDAGNES